MFCTNCGKKISWKEAFCTECRTPVKNDNPSQTLGKYISTQRTRGDLEYRAWYRFLKVLYLIIFILSILSVIGIAWLSKPSRTIDEKLSSIACNNGKYYTPSKNSIWVIGDSLDYTDDQHARILCKYDTLDFYNYRYSNEYIAKNYTFKPVYTKIDYGSWLAYSLIGLAVVWLVLRIIKLAFFYIVVGSKPRIGDFKKFI